MMVFAQEPTPPNQPATPAADGTISVVVPGQPAATTNALLAGEPTVASQQPADPPQPLPLGPAAALLSTYLWTVIAIDVGAGSNSFNKKSGQLTVTRRGFRELISVSTPLKEIQAVKVDVRDGLNHRRRLALRVQGRRDLPLTTVGEPMSLAELERGGAELARFLGVPLEGV